MLRHFCFIVLAILIGVPATFAADYVPPKGSWQTHTPEA